MIAPIRIFLSFLFFFFFLTLKAEEKEQGKGTVIISYQTGIKGERLDRIRFLLINSRQDQQMYPKKNGYVQDATGLMRVVVIENLTPGEYTLEFILPNCDALFGSIPSRKIKIEPNNTTKVDQTIPIRYASLEATIGTDEIITFSEQPKPFIVLKDIDGNEIAKSEEGVLSSKTLLPGEYLLIFGPLKNFITPPPQAIKLNPDGLLVTKGFYYKEQT